MLITNILTKQGKFYPVMSLQKKTVTVRDYVKVGYKYNDIERKIPMCNVREVFVNLKGGYWKKVCTIKK